MRATSSVRSICSMRATVSIRSSRPTTPTRVAAVLELAPAGARYEFQRLHGMGEALYAAARAEVPGLAPVRVYAPVGTHEDLLPYLVRRLLENGANSSFVHQFMNAQIPVEQVVRDPITSLAAQRPRRRGCASRTRCLAPSAPTPRARTSAIRPRSRRSQPSCAPMRASSHAGGPILGGRVAHDLSVPVTSPADTREIVGLHPRCNRGGDPPRHGGGGGGAARLGRDAGGGARRVPGAGRAAAAAAARASS